MHGNIYFKKYMYKGLSSFLYDRRKKLATFHLTRHCFKSQSTVRFINLPNTLHEKQGAHM